MQVQGMYEQIVKIDGYCVKVDVAGTGHIGGTYNGGKCRYMSWRYDSRLSVRNVFSVTELKMFN